MKHSSLRAIQKIKTFAIAHKVIAAIFVIALVFFGYSLIRSLASTSGETRYVLSAVQKGTIVASISGSGQVSASNQIDIKSKASGDVVYVGVINGQEVDAGGLILQLDARDAEKASRDAEVNLESAKLSLDKLKQPADSLSVTQAENTLAKAKETKQNAEDDLAKAYDDAFSAVSNAFIDLPGVMSGLQDILYGNTTGLGGSSLSNSNFYTNAVRDFDDRVNGYKDDADKKYQTARGSYDKNFQDYKATGRFSSTTTVEMITEETYDTSKDAAEAVKSAANLIQFYEDKLIEHNLKTPAAADSELASLNTYTGKLNTELVNLLGAKTAIKNDRDAIVNAGRTITENTESLAKLKNGADPLDIQSSELSVKQRENALLDAKEKLADYFIRAPFDGTIAKMNVKKLDSLSSGAIAATLITKQKIAELSLNEVDAAKIKIGQKATLTFDAVDGLSITGKVSDIDTVGTVSQGVVTYAVKINFDTNDDRVKAGMSVSAAIITNVKQDVLTTPNSAVKTQGSNSYVLMFDNKMPENSGSQGVPSATAPRQAPVGVGLSNDSDTEITSGLKEGDQVVVRTITAAGAAKPATAAPSLFGGGGGRGVGGGGVRVPGARGD